jgi:hypothetical protein
MPLIVGNPRVSTTLEQNPNDVSVTRKGCYMQWRVTDIIFKVWVGTMLKQKPSDVSVTRKGC